MGTKWGSSGGGTSDSRGTRGATSISTNGLVAETDELNSLWAFDLVLRQLGENVGAFGCVLWQAEGEVRDGQPLEPGRPFPRGHLFALDYWFADDRITVIEPELPVADSPEGRAALSRHTVVVERAGPSFRPDASFMLAAPGDIQSVVCVPVRFIKSSYGVVSVYGRQERAFSPSAITEIERGAELIALLYQVSRSSMESLMIDRVTNILRDAERDSEPARGDTETQRSALKQIAQLLADELRCVQTSIYLRDTDVSDTPANQEPVFHLSTSTMPIDVPFDAKPLRASDVRLSAWVIRERKPLRLFNLRDLNDNAQTRWSAVRRRYPGLTWNGEQGLEDAVLRVVEEHNLPPVRHLSYVAVPIIIGDSLLGLIRCLATHRPSNVFSMLDVMLLQRVSTLVAHFLASEHARRIAYGDAALFQELIEGVNEMCQIVVDEIAQEERLPDVAKIYARGLEVSRKLLRADSSNIRLISKDRSQLDYFETGGEAWPAGQGENLIVFKTEPWLLGENAPPSAGRHVVETQDVDVVQLPDASSQQNPRFDNVQWAIVAPISAGPHRYGVLDIRCTVPSALPRLGKIVAELLSRQMGLYHHLTDTVSELRRTRDVQVRVFRDLKHQLSSPLSQATRRMSRLIQTVRANSQLDRTLKPIQGLMGKTTRVSMNVGLFVDITRTETVKPNLRNNFDSYVLNLVSQAASDNEIEIDDYRDIAIVVDHSSFQVLRSGEVLADRALLEQAVDSLLDNATKYSYGGEIVHVSGRRIGGSHFRIVVRSRGLPIKIDETEKCKEYGWRSERAEWTTGEGNGIGLWIVDHIMKAHNGRLIVGASNFDHITEVSLELPIQPRPRS